MNLHHRVSHIPDITTDLSNPLDYLKEWIKAEEELTKLQLLQPNCVSKIIIPKNNHIKTIILLLHGFASGTWVFEDWLKSLPQDQHTLIIAPRLPGSGFMTNGQNDAQYLPHATQSQSYEEMVTAWITICQAIGGELLIAGHSSGGTLAYRLSQRHPVKSLFLIAPFFDTEDTLAKVVFSSVQWIQGHLKLPLHKVLNHIQWRLKESFNTGATDLPGHSTMTLGQLYSIYTYANTLYQVKDLPQTNSIWITASEYDTRSSFTAIKSLIKRLKNPKTKIKTNITIFQKSRQVPHAMIHPLQNNLDDITGFLKGQFLQWVGQYS